MSHQGRVIELLT